MTPPAPVADRVNLTCKVCGHTALASAALARHRLACPNCGQPLPTATAADPTPAPPPPAAPTPEPAPPETTPDRPASVWPARLIGAGTILAVAGCIGGVWYLLANHEEPAPPYDNVTSPVPIRRDFGPTPPQPQPGIGRRLQAPPVPVPPEEPGGLPK